MSSTWTETNNYDLGSTGTIAELDVSGADSVGWYLEATGSADFAVEIDGNDVGPYTVETYTGVTTIDDGRLMPEALTVRIKNTSTNSGQTADVLLGGDN